MVAPREQSHDSRDTSVHTAHALRLFALCLQVSLKSTAAPGREGKNLKANDFKYNRKTYWLTSRESPDVLWIEELMPSSDAVKAYIARDKAYAITDCSLLDAADSFDSFLSRWAAKTLVTEYCQVPTKAGSVGNAYPHGAELQDLFMETKDSASFRHFFETGEQDLDGFEGEGEDEVREYEILWREYEILSPRRCQKSTVKACELNCTRLAADDLCVSRACCACRRRHFRP